MTRIRSIHPGINTDEAWVSLSFAARWLGLGLMMIADDNGVFEWKPLQIKMQIFPADAVDVPVLLNELCVAGVITPFDWGNSNNGSNDVLSRHGRKPLQLGAIRNFVLFQRPRKPKTWFPITPEIQSFVGIECPDEPQKPKPSLFDEQSELPDVETPIVPPKSGIAPQMKEGGGRMDDEGGRIPPTPLKPSEPFIPPEPEWEEFIRYRKRINSPFTDHARKLALTALAALVAEGHDPREIINRSILNGWKGLFAPRTNGNGTANHTNGHGKSGRPDRDIDDAARRLGLGWGDVEGGLGKAHSGP